MGFLFIDQYTLLHFAVGILLYFWNFKFLTALGLHFLFEIIENTENGMKFLNKYFPKDGLFRWPGGKVAPDSFMNTMGDNISFAIGYLLAKILDDLSNKKHWYYLH